MTEEFKDPDLANAKPPAPAEQAQPLPELDGDKDLTRESGRFFRRIDWSAFWISFLLTLILYTWTLAPTVTLEDSGELVVAADYLGVPHPPGYPIWTLLAWFFQWVFHWKTYFGQPNPAWAVGWLSAVSGALTCGILSLLVCRSGADLLRGVKRVGEVLGYKSERLISWAGGVSAGLLLACSPGLWSQSVIVEVYSLNTLFLMLVLLLTFMWMKRPHEYRYLFALAFFFGLGLTNHQTLLFVGLALAAAILFRDVKLFRDFFIVGVALGIISGINIAAKKMGANSLMWRNGPWSQTSVAFYVHSFFFIAFPVLAIFVLPKGKIVGPTILLALLGVSFYLYLPFASEGNPPMNWAYPRTWEGFLHSITRGQYERVTLSNIFGDPEKFMGQLGAYVRDLRMQYKLWISMVAMLPFASWSIKIDEKRRFNLFYPAVGLIVLTFAFSLVAAAVLPKGLEGLTTTDRPAVAKIYKFFALGLFGLASVGIVGIIINFFRKEMKGVNKNTVWGIVGLAILVGLVLCASNTAVKVIGVGLLGGLIFTLIVTDISKVGLAPIWGTAILAVVVVIVAMLDFRLLLFIGQGSGKMLMVVAILGPPILVAVTWYLITSSFEFDNEIPEFFQRWILVTIVSFFALSVILIIFLNHKLDIQTLFIGRVQLIQSHAVYAIWLGYGLMYALARIEVTVGGGRLVKVLGATALAALLPLASFFANWTDQTRIEIIGGTEQNGHDYGWQFGRYQLEGAPAINEECEIKGIESPPNPEYPPPMTSGAIFYGGTDPGRFVPTYMIYSAKVRPDVFLITQNALADNTYMNVMRDLYGDDIWIPSTQDSNQAFQQYVKDVKDGRIQAGAAVTIKDGRVSVQGVQGVMTINGILAEEIFKFNKHKHDFYVEESYVIPWMYPYLEPHGLIMKINKEPIQVTKEMTKNDRDFWDWYTKNLIGEIREKATDAEIQALKKQGRRVRIISDNKDGGIRATSDELDGTVRPNTFKIVIDEDRKFIRDVVARKTFSKLRSAIAGIYAYRRNFQEAIHAFEQAIELYPLSPEANFRLADIFMQSGKFQEAEDVIEKLVKQDPGNDRVAAFLGQIRTTRDRDEQRKVLEARFQKGDSDIDKAIQLIRLYQQLGRRQQFDGLVKQLLNEKRIPAGKYLEIGQICANTKRFDLLQMAMRKYLEREPNNPRIWMDLAAVQVQLKSADAAVQSLASAIAVGGEPVKAAIMQDKRLAPLRGMPAFQKLIPAARPQQPGNFNMNNITIPGL